MRLYLIPIPVGNRSFESLVLRAESKKTKKKNKAKTEKAERAKVKWTVKMPMTEELFKAAVTNENTRREKGFGTTDSSNIGN